MEGELEEVLKQPSDNFVTVILTDKVDVNVFDMQDRLRHAFPNLLEIRREKRCTKPIMKWKNSGMRQSDALSLCCEFIGDERRKREKFLRKSSIK